MESTRMFAPLRFSALAALALAAAAPARASAGVDIVMAVQGSKGSFTAQDGRGSSWNGTGWSGIKVTAVAMDFVPGSTDLKPLVVTKPVDQTTGQFLDALASGDTLSVVIAVATSSDASARLQRVVRLTNARVTAVHDALDSNAGQGLGTETVAFTYERIEVADGGVKVFSAGG